MSYLNTWVRYPPAPQNKKGFNIPFCIYMKNKKTAELEHKIMSKIFIDNKNTVHFSYRENIIKNVKLEVYTYNGQTEQLFLFFKTTADTELECLKKTLKHLEDIHIGNNKSFTIRWKNGQNEHISYFSAYDDKEAIQKCQYLNKNIDILDVKQNPIS